MITWKFDLNRQTEYYNTFLKQVKEKSIWQDLKYYVLPFMPEKFRGRVIFLPEVCEPLKIYRKQKYRLNKLEFEWAGQNDFEEKLIKYFPKLNDVNVVISPSFYGSVGWYGFWDSGKTILIRPRYDRKIIDIQKLVVNALTHYFYISKENNLDKKLWLKKQKLAKDMQAKIFLDTKESKNSKNVHDILNTEFSGNLAKESFNYLEKLGIYKKQNIKVLKKLTKTENKIFNLMISNRDKLVTSDEIAKEIWGENYFDKYSEYAIAKHIEQLKKKITKNSIHNQRKQGYLMI